MTSSPRQALPLGPLLQCYTAAGPPTPEALGDLPELGPRFRAIGSAREEFLNERFIDAAEAAEFQAALVRFYEAAVSPALHTPTVTRRAGLVRFALGHLMRGTDPLSRKLAHCLTADGPYHVAGLGPAFWSALLQGLDPRRNPAWLPGVVAGLRRLGLARWRNQDGPERVYAGLLEAYGQLRSLAPNLTALHLDHFLTLVAAMRGRDLFAVSRGSPDVATVVRQERARSPLRQRLRERGQTLDEARQRLEAALAARDGPGIGAALALTDPNGFRSARIDWQARAETLTQWVARLWEADDPYLELETFWQADPVAGAGLWLPVAVLHLRAPSQFHLWDEGCRQGYALLDDAAAFGATPAERYRLFNEGAESLRARHRLHPLEVPAVLTALAVEDRQCDDAPPQAAFGGFCADTFRFLAELAANNRRDWMGRQRDRYRFAVRDPLGELCRALAERYVEPVLRREWGWDVETEPRSGRALTSICKNDYGRSAPYNTALWITFYRRGWKGGAAARRRDEAQFFVRLDAAGLSYGLCLGRDAREAGRVFRDNVQEHAELLHRVLSENGALAECRFGMAAALSDEGTGDEPRGPDTLRAWVAPKGRRRTGGASPAATQLVVAKCVPAGSPLLASDELVGDVLLTFDRLLPLYTCALGPGLHPALARHAAGVDTDGYTEADFRRATFVGDDWLRRAKMLLDLKRQIILQGVPGTGKTHLARCLARLLTHGRDDAVRLVQFHPAYSYEEFVEGIKVKSVEVNGKHDVTYPVEDGLLCAFAAEAACRPAEPHVLIIDEINRGNLPRVFGELLYLLEYREQTLNLPYSKRGFRLPANLYLIGTMNAADRSVALVDQALRRRFSFVEIAPDAAVLAAWLRSRPPRAGTEFADSVVSLFVNLNARLRQEAGPHCQVGHSYFMVPDLDEARLRAVWEHQIGPLLDEYFAGQPGKAAAYDLDELLAGGAGEPARRKRRPAGVT